MNEQSFIENLQTEFLDSKNIQISITKAKGIITLFWSSSFSNQTHQSFFNEHFDEIEWANSKIQHISEKFKPYYLKHKLLTEADAIHFDLVAPKDVTPVKKAYQSNCYSFGGYSQFRVPA